MSEPLYRMEFLTGHVRLEMSYRTDAEGWTHTMSRKSVYDQRNCLVEIGQWEDVGLAWKMQ